MTEREIDQLLRRWQQRMGLERWDVKLDFERPSQQLSDEEYCHASTFRSNHYEQAKINLHPDWRGWDIAEAEGHVVHELVHLWTRDLEEVLKLVEEQVPFAIYRTIDTAFTQRLEGAVDLIARRLVSIAGEAA